MKGPTRAQLARRLARAEREVSDLRRQLTTEGRHWHELVEYFDADQIQSIPVAERVFLLGMLEHAVVVEIPPGTSARDMESFHDALRSQKITAPVLYVQRGVRFLRMRPVAPDLADRLDAASQVNEAAPDEDAETADAAAGALAGAGPVATGDRLGGRDAADGADHGSGGDRDAPAGGAAAEAADSG